MYHLLNCIQLFIYFFRVHKSYQYGFQYHIHFRVRFQTHVYVILYFLSCYQDSHFQSDINRSPQSQIKYFDVLWLQHLLYYFPEGLSHPLHY